MKILLIGSGGREHALTHAFVRKGHQVLCLPGNAGIDTLTLPKPEEWKKSPHLVYSTLTEIALKNKIDLTVVGPEAPLADGIVDLFREKNLTIFGPTQQGAQIESSKVWSKEFMVKYDIPTAPFYLSDSPIDALDAAKKNLAEWPGIVIKPDGLTAGKGVILCHTMDEAKEAIKQIMEDEKFGNSGKRIIIEKMLSGPEVSILAFCDGEQIVPMIPSQDHKKLLEGDAGPNTGGIGAYSPLPFLTTNELEHIKNNVIRKTLLGLQEERIQYKGVLYFGLMMTASGPQVLEYNCRFGDPESQVILPLLESDLAEIMFSCCTGNLSSEAVQWSDQSACCIIMTSQGYPEKFQTGYEISGLDKVSGLSHTHCYHSGTLLQAEGKVVTHGGRVLGITGLGPDLETAIKRAYHAVDMVNFEGAYYRKDIGHQAITSKIVLV